MRPLLPLALAGTLAAALAGCTQVSTVRTVVPEPPSGPAGPGCAAQIGRFREILDYDLSVGRVAKPVHDKAIIGVGQADSACSAGRSGDAMAILARTKRASGYP